MTICASANARRLSMQPTVIPSGAGRFFLPRSLPVNASARAVEESLFGRSLDHPIQNHPAVSIPTPYQM
jgi:hypothetical protein